MESLIALIIFVVVTSAVLVGGRRLLGLDARVDERLSQLQQQLSVLPTNGRATGNWWQRNTSSRRSGGQILSNPADEKNHLQAQLMHAGIYSPWALQFFLTVRLSLMAGPPVTGFAVDYFGWVPRQQGLMWGAALGACGMLLPSMWLSWRKRRRHIVFTWSLPDFLDLLVACLEAGMSIEAAMQRVADELLRVHPVLGSEMKAVQTQIELGATPEAALRSLADRSDYDAIRSLSTVVQQARRFGTGIAEALRQHANSLRIQREQVAEEKAQKASMQILVPTMLLIFPAIFVVLAGPAAIKLSESFAPERTPATSSASSVRSR